MAKNMTQTTGVAKRVLAVLLALFMALAVLSSCGGEPGEITIEDPWSRQPAPGQPTSAVYGLIKNTTGADVRIVSASTNVTETTEIHETIIDEAGVMSMREKTDGFVVSAGGSFSFEPGGPHIMLMGIDPDTYPETVTVTLNFDNNETMEFEAEVREIAGMAGMDHGDMDHGSMDHGDGEHSEMDHGDGERGDMDHSEGEHSDS